MSQVCEYSGIDRRSSDRRTLRVNVFLDRRTGFDRRAGSRGGGVNGMQGVLLWLRDRPVALLGLLGLVNVLNVADYLLTLNVLGAGGGEANPVMRSLFNLDPVWAAVFKVAAILLASWIVWRYRRYRLALQAALVMGTIFGLVLFYHILGVTVLG